MSTHKSKKLIRLETPPTAEPGPPPSGGKVHSKSSLEVRLKKLEHALDEIRSWCACDWAADGANAEEVIAEIEKILASVEEKPWNT